MASGLVVGAGLTPCTSVPGTRVAKSFLEQTTRRALPASQHPLPRRSERAVPKDQEFAATALGSASTAILVTARRASKKRGQARRQFCARGGVRSCASLALATQLGTQDPGTSLEQGVFAHSVGEAVRAAFAHSLVTCGPGLAGSLRALGWTLYSTLRAFFVTAVAAQLCTSTFAHQCTYWRYVLPWYLLNKSGVSDQTLGRLLGELTHDPELKELFKEHARVRALERCGVEEKRRISELDLAHWGGCLACQYWGVSPQAFRRDWDLHVRLAAALHVLDDYLDQHEDQGLGAYNYFVNHPEPKEVAWWIQETLCCRAHFAETGQLSIVRLIDGSLTFYGLADEFMFGTFFAQCDTNTPEFVAPRGLIAWRWLFARVF